MARIKRKPPPKANRPIRKSKANVSSTVEVEYGKWKNDKLLVELKRRGLPKPKQVNKDNLITALEQDDATRAAAPESENEDSQEHAPVGTTQPASSTGSPLLQRSRANAARVGKRSRRRATARPANIRTRPQTPLARIQHLQKLVGDVRDWVLLEKDRRLNGLADTLARACKELDRVAAPYWQISPVARPDRRAMSVSASGRRLSLAGDARYGPTKLFSPPPPVSGHSAAQNRRAASLGAEPLRTSPVAPAPKLKASRPDQQDYDPVIGDLFNRAPAAMGEADDREAEDLADEEQEVEDDEEDDVGSGREDEGKVDEDEFEEEEVEEDEQIDDGEPGPAPAETSSEESGNESASE